MPTKVGYRVIDENFDKDTVRAETSFTESGLDFPLGSPPESETGFIQKTRCITADI